MNRRVSIVVLVGALAIGLVVAARYAAIPGIPAPAGVAADGRGRPVVRFVKHPIAVPPFTMTDLAGREISTASWRGKVTLVNFWATWCPPCRAEIPDLIALQDKYKDHLQIIGVSTDEAAPAVVQRFADEHRINYPIVMVTDRLRESFPGVFALPTTFIVDPDGRTVQKHVGLLSPAIYEEETRVLAGLTNDTAVERVEDTGQVLLANAALATEIPGVDLSRLAPEQKRVALERLNAEKCVCGCDLTLAQCRINDASCRVSLPIAKQLVDKISKGSS